MAHILLAACVLGAGTGGSRRRQAAVVPIGTKKVVEWIGFGDKVWREWFMYQVMPFVWEHKQMLYM